MADTPAADGDKPADKEADRRSREQVDKRLAQSAAVSHARIRLGGQDLEYTVNAAYLPVMANGFAGAHAEPDAAVFATAYLCKLAANAQRPVCFAFNGGPGSASIWLQFGALGPKHVPMPSDGSQPRAPFRVVDNPLSWFEHFDMVFIDPPHTGWSVSASEAARKKMLSVDGDVEALSECVRVWLTRHKRWGSPVYLAGESYGTTRGAALADRLQSLGVSLSGVILISCAMDLQSLVFAPRNDLPHALFLPGFANAAQYHGLLKGAPAKSSQAAREAAEAFVADDYVAALHAGARLDGRRRSRIAQRIAELSGLPRALVEQRNLRIGTGAAAKTPATPSPAPAPIWAAPCAATRT
jgi:carboxypeptidase C (cathepsin A)